MDTTFHRNFPRKVGFYPVFITQCFNSNLYSSNFVNSYGYTHEHSHFTKLLLTINIPKQRSLLKAINNFVTSTKLLSLRAGRGENWLAT